VKNRDLVAEAHLGSHCCQELAYLCNMPRHTVQGFERTVTEDLLVAGKYRPIYVYKAYYARTERTFISKYKRVTLTLSCCPFCRKDLTNLKGNY
jgi:hypothetical protein